MRPLSLTLNVNEDCMWLDNFHKITNSKALQAGHNYSNTSRHFKLQKIGMISTLESGKQFMSQAFK